MNSKPLIKLIHQQPYFLFLVNRNPWMIYKMLKKRYLQFLTNYKISKVILFLQYKQSLFSMIINQSNKIIMNLLLTLSKNYFHPLIFFLQIVSRQLFTNVQSSLILFIIGVGMLIIFKINYFWYIGIFINPSIGYLAVPNLFIGLLSCNEMWKLILYIYVVSDQILLNFGSVDIFFHLIGIFGILTNTYKNLTFASLYDNYVYFVGFSGIMIFELITFVEENIILENQTIYISKAIITMMAIFSSFIVFQNRIRSMRNSSIQQIQSPYEFLHYISELKINLNNPLQKIGIQKTHKRQCTKLDCFCKDQSEQLSFDHMFIRSIFLIGYKKFQNTYYQNILKEYYIDHLIQFHMFPLAVEQYLKMDKQKTNIFNKLRKLNLQKKLLRQLQKNTQNYDEKSIFENAFYYEKNYEKLKRDILELVELKMKFWKQISKVVTKVNILNEVGTSILIKLNEVDDFYKNEISPVQNQLKIYHGSIIYNLFLLVATNYKQNAQKNIKLIKKNMETNTSELKKNQKSFYIKVSINQQNFATIQNLTNNFFKLFKTTLPKSYFIGKDMSFLVPKPYINQHLRGMRELRRFNHSLQLGKNLSPIFFLNKNDQLVSCNLVVKYSIDILNQLSIIGFVKQLSNDSQYALLDLNGKHINTTSGKIDLSLLKTEVIQQKVKKIKQQWSNMSVIEQPYVSINPIKIQIRHKQISYTCILDSPFSTSFRYPNPPPIHLKIYNETQNQFIQNQEDSDIVCYFKKIDHILDFVETDSQCSYMSRSCQIIDIVKKMEGISNFPFLKQFIIVMTIIFSLIFIFSIIYYVSFNVTWIPPYQPKGNQYELLLTLYEIQLNAIKIINKGLSLTMITNNIFNNSMFSTIYGVSDYKSNAYTDIHKLCKSLDNEINTNLIEQSLNINPNFINNLKKKLIVVNTFNNKNYTQTTSLNSLLRKSVGDCIQLANGQSLYNTTIGQIYWRTIYSNLKNLIAITKTTLYQSLEQNTTNNIILLICFEITMILCWIPIYYLNSKIDQQDIYIYQLITSVQLDYINNEVQQLIDLQIRLKSNQSRSNASYNKDSNLQKQYELSSYDQQNLFESKLKRNRNGNLDTTQKIKQNRYGCLNIILPVIVIAIQFFIKNQQFIFIKNSLNNQVQIREWRNQRSQLLVNIKKNISNYQNSQNIAQLTNYQWIKSTFINRTKNYPTTDIPYDFSPNCTNSVVCSQNTSFSTYLSLDSFFEVTASKIFFTTDSSQQIIVLEALEQICTTIVANQYPKYDNDLNNNIIFYDRALNLIFGCSLGLLLLNQVVIIIAYKKLKYNYINVMRLVTLLSQQMVKKNKRVQSFLLKLCNIS